MDKPRSWGICWVVVTGASRGFGASLCEIIADLLSEGSVIVGIARNNQGLLKTQSLVNQINPGVKFLCFPCDLGMSSENQLDDILMTSLKEIDLNKLSKSMIIHNAGSLGSLDYLRNISDPQLINQYFNFNIGSVLTLNTLFLKKARSLSSKMQLYVLHTSSLCAIQPIRSWGMYCIGKAGRDMLFKVIAEEEKDVIVLNYAPGPLDNEMQDEIQRETADPEIKQMFVNLKIENKLLSCKTSAEKLIKILSENKFKSGDHVDYYDEL